MKGQDKKFIKTISNTIALFGGREDLLSIIQNDKQPLKKSIEQLEDWNDKKVEEIKDRLQLF